MTLLLLQLAACAVLIGCAGFLLCKSADRLAEAYGWQQGWVGLALLATITSLPELVSGASAVLLVEAPDLAAGNALGACVVNLTFLVFVELVQRSQPVYRSASPSHLLSAAFGVVMLGFIALSIVMGEDAPRFMHVGWYSPALFLLYLLVLRNVHRYEQDLTPGEKNPVPGHVSARREWLRFGLAAAVVVAAALWLPRVADGLATELGLGRSFVGTSLMALVTAMPELAVTLSAVRLKALDMAIGNLLGSNLFNVVVLTVDDLLYLRGPLLADVDAVHAATAITAVIMTGMVMVGLVLRVEGRVLRRVSWVGVGLFAAYLLNTGMAYLQG